MQPGCGGAFGAFGAGWLLALTQTRCLTQGQGFTASSEMLSTS